MIDSFHFFLLLLIKMKRNTLNDNEDELIITRKKLKFGVDTILGNVNTNQDNSSSFEIINDSDEELKHKGNLFLVLVFSKKHIFVSTSSYSY